MESDYYPDKPELTCKFCPSCDSLDVMRFSSLEKFVCIVR
jgi:hypothetical protein